MPKQSLSEILQLSVPERLQLVEDIWDSIAEVPEALELTEEQKQELDRRVAEHRRNPSAVIPWEEVKRRILQRR